MTDEKWQQLIDVAELQFQNVEIKREDLMVETPEGTRKEGTKDILIFENQAGRFKLERENTPKVTGKTMHYSHRPNTSAQVDYKFSDTEFTHRLYVFQDTGYNDWDEITLDKLGLV